MSDAMGAVPTIGLVADDLTGALDTAAKLAPLAGPLCYVANPETGQMPPQFALNTGTRELSAASPLAAKRVRAYASHLAFVDLAFLKIDSLLRGRIAADVRVLFELGLFDRCVIAPALPEQHRWTEHGRQHVRDAGGTRQTGPDLVRELIACDVPATHLRRGEMPRGADWALVADARGLNDLCQHVDMVQRGGGRILYCGAGGLAHALASAAPAPVPVWPTSSSPPRAPILAIIGSFHPVTQAQMARLTDTAQLHLATHGPQIDPEQTLAELTAALSTGRSASLSFDFPHGTDRSVAEKTIKSTLATMVPLCPRPGSLLVVGGETLAQMVAVLGVEQIRVLGENSPGVPRSVLLGGRWDGLEMCSKSGAFGQPDLLCRMLQCSAR